MTLRLIEECKKDPSIDKKFEILHQINSMFLKSDQLLLPFSSSLLLDYYINRVLDKMEGLLETI